jgi:hypothetical protein
MESEGMELERIWKGTAMVILIADYCVPVVSAMRNKIGVLLLDPIKVRLE